MCGIPIDRPALGVNRLCGSGFQSIVNAAQDIMLGAAKISLTGGVESMSMAPFVVRNIRFGTGLGVPNAFEDSLWVSHAMGTILQNNYFFGIKLNECFIIGRFDRHILQITNGYNSRKFGCQT